MASFFVDVTLVLQPAAYSEGAALVATQFEGLLGLRSGVGSLCGVLSLMPDGSIQVHLCLDQLNKWLWSGGVAGGVAVVVVYSCTANVSQGSCVWSCSAMAPAQGLCSMQQHACWLGS